jgi:hypothetical protein
MISKKIGRKKQPKITANDLIRREARLGGTIFGPIPKGHDRQFFCLDEYTWIWHESWMKGRERVSITTRYEVRGDQVFKTQQNQPMRLLTGVELDNLARATEIYDQLISTKIYPGLMTA